MRKLSLILALLMVTAAVPAKAANDDFSVSAQAAAVIECGTNTVLYAKNEHEKLPMASTTKVMTAIIAIECGNPDEVFAVCDEAYGVEGSSIYLLKNERISLRDLLYGLMLRSGNDAAVAIAHKIGGSTEGFVDLMNDKAHEIGAYDTHFANPNGLPSDEHYTTAYDLALICSYAMKNEIFRTIVGTQYYTADSGDVHRTMMNKNKLLTQYDGANGIKTGYTKAAGKCLTFSAEREGMSIVGVVLNCPDMFPDSMKIMDRCFSEYSLYTVVRKGTPVLRTDVYNSDVQTVLVTANDIKVPVKKSEGISLSTRVYARERLSAPIDKGTCGGRLDLYKGDTLIASCPLVAESSAEPASFFHHLHTVIQMCL